MADRSLSLSLTTGFSDVDVIAKKAQGSIQEVMDKLTKLSTATNTFETSIGKTFKYLRSQLKDYLKIIDDVVKKSKAASDGSITIDSKSMDALKNSITEIKVAMQGAEKAVGGFKNELDTVGNFDKDAMDAFSQFDKELRDFYKTASAAESKVESMGKTYNKAKGALDVSNSLDASKRAIVELCQSIDKLNKSLSSIKGDDGLFHVFLDGADKKLIDDFNTIVGCIKEIKTEMDAVGTDLQKVKEFAPNITAVLRQVEEFSTKIATSDILTKFSDLTNGSVTTNIESIASTLIGVNTEIAKIVTSMGNISVNNVISPEQIKSILDEIGNVRAELFLVDTSICNVKESVDKLLNGDGAKNIGSMINDITSELTSLRDTMKGIGSINIINKQGDIKKRLGVSEYKAAIGELQVVLNGAYDQFGVYQNKIDTLMKSIGANNPNAMNALKRFKELLTEQMVNQMQGTEYIPKTLQDTIEYYNRLKGVISDISVFSKAIGIEHLLVPLEQERSVNALIKEIGITKKDISEDTNQTQEKSKSIIQEITDAINTLKGIATNSKEIINNMATPLIDKISPAIESIVSSLNMLSSTNGEMPKIFEYLQNVIDTSIAKITDFLGESTIKVSVEKFGETAQTVFENITTDVNNLNGNLGVTKETIDSIVNSLGQMESKSHTPDLQQVFSNIANAGNSIGEVITESFKDIGVAVDGMSTKLDNVARHMLGAAEIMQKFGHIDFSNPANIDIGTIERSYNNTQADSDAKEIQKNLDAVSQAYSILLQAQAQYMTAYRNGDQVAINYWGGQIDGAEQMIDTVEKAYEAMKIRPSIKSDDKLTNSMEILHKQIEMSNNSITAFKVNLGNIRGIELPGFESIQQARAALKDLNEQLKLWKKYNTDQYRNSSITALDKLQSVCDDFKGSQKDLKRIADIVALGEANFNDATKAVEKYQKSLGEVAAANKELDRAKHDIGVWGANYKTSDTDSRRESGRAVIENIQTKLNNNQIAGTDEELDKLRERLDELTMRFNKVSAAEQNWISMQVAAGSQTKTLEQQMKDLEKELDVQLDLWKRTKSDDYRASSSDVFNKMTKMATGISGDSEEFKRTEDILSRAGAKFAAAQKSVDEYKKSISRVSLEIKNMQQAQSDIRAWDKYFKTSDVSAYKNNAKNTIDAMNKLLENPDQLGDAEEVKRFTAALNELQMAYDKVEQKEQKYIATQNASSKATKTAAQVARGHYQTLKDAISQMSKATSEEDRTFFEKIISAEDEYFKKLKDQSPDADVEMYIHKASAAMETYNGKTATAVKEMEELKRVTGLWKDNAKSEYDASNYERQAEERLKIIERLAEEEGASKRVVKIREDALNIYRKTKETVQGMNLSIEDKIRGTVQSLQSAVEDYDKAADGSEAKSRAATSIEYQVSILDEYMGTLELMSNRTEKLPIQDALAETLSLVQRFKNEGVDAAEAVKKAFNMNLQIFAKPNQSEDDDFRESFNTTYEKIRDIYSNATSREEALRKCNDVLIGNYDDEFFDDAFDKVWNAFDYGKRKEREVAKKLIDSIMDDENGLSLEDAIAKLEEAHDLFIKNYGDGQNADNVVETQSTDVVADTVRENVARTIEAANDAVNEAVKDGVNEAVANSEGVQTDIIEEIAEKTHQSLFRGRHYDIPLIDEDDDDDPMFYSETFLQKTRAFILNMRKKLLDSIRKQEEINSTDDDFGNSAEKEIEDKTSEVVESCIEQVDNIEETVVETVASTVEQIGAGSDTGDGASKIEDIVADATGNIVEKPLESMVSIGDTVVETIDSVVEQISVQNGIAENIRKTEDIVVDGAKKIVDAQLEPLQKIGDVASQAVAEEVEAVKSKTGNADVNTAKQRMGKELDGLMRDLMGKWNGKESGSWGTEKDGWSLEDQLYGIAAFDELIKEISGIYEANSGEHYNLKMSDKYKSFTDKVADMKQFANMISSLDELYNSIDFTGSNGDEPLRQLVDGYSQWEQWLNLFADSRDKNVSSIVIKYKKAMRTAVKSLEKGSGSESAQRDYESAYNLFAQKYSSANSVAMIPTNIEDRMNRIRELVKIIFSVEETVGDIEIPQSSGEPVDTKPVEEVAETVKENVQKTIATTSEAVSTSLETGVKEAAAESEVSQSDNAVDNTSAETVRSVAKEKAIAQLKAMADKLKVMIGEGVQSIGQMEEDAKPVDQSVASSLGMSFKKGLVLMLNMVYDSITKIENSDIDPHKITASLLGNLETLVKKIFPAKEQIEGAVDEAVNETVSETDVDITTEVVKGLDDVTNAAKRSTEAVGAFKESVKKSASESVYTNLLSNFEPDENVVTRKFNAESLLEGVSVSYEKLNALIKTYNDEIGNGNFDAASKTKEEISVLVDGLKKVKQAMSGIDSADEFESGINDYITKASNLVDKNLGPIAQANAAMEELKKSAGLWKQDIGETENTEYKARAEYALAVLEALKEQFGTIQDINDAYQKGNVLFKKTLDDMEGEAGKLKETEEHYKKIDEAVNKYKKAVNEGDVSGAQVWQSKILAEKAYFDNLQKIVNETIKDEQVRKQINKLIGDAVIKIKQFGEANNTVAIAGKQLEEIFDRVVRSTRIFATMQIDDILRKALEYSREFDKAITDIGIITGSSIDQARALGDAYRKLADELGVSSTDIATAAASIYRQGYRDTEDVTGILKGITQFAAVTDVTSDEALENMTSSMKAFGDEATNAEDLVERIGDTWSYMGDSVATTGSEIATAMNKSAASVKLVGLEFEKASAYAAIMLDTTQQSGDVIGTQLNSLVARYTKITSAGYKKITSDDDGEKLSFNDVSKALNSIGISMIDENGDFKNFGDVMDALAEKWDGLTDAQQKYVATALGGTRGLNYLTALMNNYDRALELTAEAMNANGTVAQKYQTWLQGAEAAQNNLNNSLENLWAVLKADYLTDFYNSAAGVIDFLTEGSDLMDGWNIKLPLILTGLMAVAGGVVKIVNAIKAAMAAFKAGQAGTGLAALFTPKTILAIVAAVAAVATVVGSVAASIKNASMKYDEYKEQAQEYQNTADNYKSIADSLNELKEKEGDAADTSKEFYALRKQLVEQSALLQEAYGNEGEKIESVGDAYEIATGKAKEYIIAARAAAALNKDANKKAYNTAYDEVYSKVHSPTQAGFTSMRGLTEDAKLFSKNNKTIKQELGILNYSELDTLLQNAYSLIFADKDNGIYSEDYSKLKESQRSQVDDYVSYLKSLYIVAEGETDNVKSALENLVDSILSDSRYDVLATDNMEIYNTIKNAITDFDFGDMSADEIESVINKIIPSIMNGLSNGLIDASTLLAGDGDILSTMIQAMLKFPSQNTDSYFSSAEVFMEDAIRVLFLNIGKDVPNNLEDYLNTNDWSNGGEQIISTLYSAIAYAAEHAENGDVDTAVQDVIDSFMDASDKAAWAVEIAPTIIPDEDVIEDEANSLAEKFTEYLTSAIDKEELNRAKANNYSAQMKGINDAFKSGGAAGVLQYASDLYVANEDLAKAFIDASPELLKFQDETLSTADAEKVLLEWTTRMANGWGSAEDSLISLTDAEKKYRQENEATAAKNAYYKPQIAQLRNAYGTAYANALSQGSTFEVAGQAGVEAAQNTLAQMNAENSTIVTGMMDMHPVLYTILQDGATWTDVLNAMGNAYDNAAEGATSWETRTKQASESGETLLKYQQNLEAERKKTVGFKDELMQLQNAGSIEEMQKVLKGMDASTLDAMESTYGWVKALEVAENGATGFDEVIGTAIDTLNQQEAMTDRSSKTLGSLFADVSEAFKDKTVSDVKSQADAIKSYREEINSLTEAGKDGFNLESFKDTHALEAGIDSVTDFDTALSFLGNRITNVENIWGVFITRLGFGTQPVVDLAAKLKELQGMQNYAQMAIDLFDADNTYIPSETMFSNLWNNYTDIQDELANAITTGDWTPVWNALRDKAQQGASTWSKYMGDAISKQEIDDATNNKWAEQMSGIRKAMSTNGREGVVAYMAQLYEDNASLAQSFASANPELMKFYNSTLSDAEAMEILDDWVVRLTNDWTDATTARKALSDAQIKHAQDEETQAAKVSNYSGQIDALSNSFNAAYRQALDSGYTVGSAYDFAAQSAIDTLVQFQQSNSTMTSGMLETHESLYTLIEDGASWWDILKAITTAQKEVANGASSWGTIVKNAQNSGVTLLNYEQGKNATYAQNKGFRDQLKELDSKSTLSEMQQYMGSLDDSTRNAMISEYAWINALITGQGTVEDYNKYIGESIDLLDLRDTMTDDSSKTLHELIGEEGAYANVTKSEVKSAAEQIKAYNTQIAELEKYKVNGNVFDVAAFKEQYSGKENIETVTDLNTAISWLNGEVFDLNFEWSTFIEKLGLTTSAGNELISTFNGLTNSGTNYAQVALNMHDNDMDIDSDTLTQLWNYVDLRPAIRKAIEEGNWDDLWDELRVQAERGATEFVTAFDGSMSKVQQERYNKHGMRDFLTGYLGVDTSSAGYAELTKALEAAYTSGDTAIQSAATSFVDTYASYLYDLKNAQGDVNAETAIWNALLAEMAGTRERIIGETNTGIFDLIYGSSVSEENRMSVDEVIEAYNLVKEMTEELNTLNEDNTFHLSEFIKKYPEAAGEVTNYAEAIEWLKEKVADAKDVFGEFFDILGLTFDSEEDLSGAFMDATFGSNAAVTAIKKLNKGLDLTEDNIKSLISEYPQLTEAVRQFTNGEITASQLLQKINSISAQTDFKDFASSIYSSLSSLKDQTKGTLEYNKTLEEIGQMFTNGLGDLSPLQFATKYLTDIQSACDGSEAAFRRLQEAAWVHIVGSSDVDFSTLFNNITAVSDEAMAMAQWLTSLGMFELKTVTATEDITVPTFDKNGNVSMQTYQAGARYTVLTPVKSNPFKSVGKQSTSKSSSSSGKSGSGSGGSGSSSVSVSTPIQKMVDQMKYVQDNYTHLLKMIDSTKDIYSGKGEIQSSIKLTEQERNVVQMQNDALESNIKKLEKQMAAKEKIMRNNKASSNAYKQAAKDLELLNKTHQQYTEELQSNNKKLNDLNDNIKKLRADARQTVIDVQDLIRKTLQDYYAYQKSILEGTISVQDLILAAIKSRYENERDAIVDSTQTKIDAIQDEIESIDDLIEERKKLLEEEEEEIEIEELKAKIARISADPTRKKEALELQKELSEKQKDMAWDTYEEEMNAQKDAITDEKEELEDYIKSVKEYYEDLLSHPMQMIEEMKTIISQTDDSIIEFLKTNTDEFSTYTAEKQQQTIDKWKEALNQMRGETETYSDEIQKIMQMSDEEIIEWLKKYNVEFNNATKEQQESYLSTWKDTLSAWRSAYKEAADYVSTYNYQPTTYYSGSSSGGSSSGGTSGGSGTTSSSQMYQGSAVYSFKGPSNMWTTLPAVTVSADRKNKAQTEAMKQAFNAARSYAQNAWSKFSPKNQNYSKPKKVEALKDISNATYSNPRKYIAFVKKYKTGGMAYNTGLAWVDGTRSKPERILSAYQTELFEDLIESLHQIKMLSVTGLGGMSTPSFRDSGNGRGFTIENISVNVDGLNTDADYEEMAEKVGKVLKEKMTRTLSIGGIII